MSIITAIDTAFMNMKKRDWDKIYYFFDIHETVLYPNYGRDEPLTFYPDSKIVLQYLTTREANDLGIETVKDALEYHTRKGLQAKIITPRSR